MNGGGPATRVVRRQWRIGAGEREDLRSVAEEVPVALTYRGCSYAVMMATPADLEDFAVGFSLTEGIVSSIAEIEAVALRPQDDGIVVDTDLVPRIMDRFWDRRRFIAGPSGCGLCGVESITQALRPVRPISSECRFAPGQITAAMAALPRLQALNRETHAVHAAALWRPGTGIAALREDVGRHNALDKLIGALARAAIPAADGILLLTSRVSVEMVQKACASGASVLAAISAPTSLAIRTAQAAGLTLIGVARDDGFEIFTQPQRLLAEPMGEVA